MWFRSARDNFGAPKIACYLCVTVLLEYLNDVTLLLKTLNMAIENVVSL